MYRECPGQKRAEARCYTVSRGLLVTLQPSSLPILGHHLMPEGHMLRRNIECRICLSYSLGQCSPPLSDVLTNVDNQSSIRFSLWAESLWRIELTFALSQPIRSCDRRFFIRGIIPYSSPTNFRRGRSTPAYDEIYIAPR